MYVFKFQIYFNKFILIEKNLIKSSKLLSICFSLKLCLYFIYKHNLKDKNLKINLLQQLFFYLRRLEQLALQRFLFKIINYRWSIKFKEFSIDTFENKKEVVYCLFSTLLNNELIYFINLKRYFFAKYFNHFRLKSSFFFYKKTFGFINFFILSNLFRTNNLFLKKLYKQRLYFHYNFFCAEYYNKMIINLFGCI